jgi:hypothetical protein
LAGQPIQISYKMTKERPFTPSGLTKKRTLEQEFYEKNIWLVSCFSLIKKP